MSVQNTDTAQTRFDQKYITSREILRRLKITRPSISQARRRNLLPDAIEVSGTLLIWERDKVEPYLKAWETILTARRSQPQA
jgi:hypothetical protein